MALPFVILALGLAKVPLGKSEERDDWVSNQKGAGFPLARSTTPSCRCPIPNPPWPPTAYPSIEGTIP